MSFSSDEVNFLVYRYLQESGMDIGKYRTIAMEKAIIKICTSGNL